VKEYWMAVGTTNGGTDVQPWELMGGRTERTIENLNLSSTRTIYVSVKALNGAGQWSTVGNSGALVVDATPPVVDSIILPTVAPSPLPTTPAATGTSCTTTSQNFWQQPGTMTNWDGDYSNTYGRGAIPSMVVNLPKIVDAESGISYLMWAVAPQAITAATMANGYYNWHNVDAYNGLPSTITVEGYELQYNNPYVLTVVAYNRANNTTFMSSKTFSFTDQTPPKPPSFCADPGWNSGEFNIRVNEPAADGETPIAGYQIRITKSDGTVVRNFPAPGTYDFGTNSDIRWGSQFTVSGIQISVEGPLYMDIRAANKLGQLGRFTRSGPILVDTSPPPDPSVTMTVTEDNSFNYFNYGGVSMRLKGTIVVTPDAQSGLSNVEYSVGTSPGGGDIQWWQALPNADKPYVENDPNKYSFDVDVPFNTQYGTTIYLSARTRNKSSRTSGTTTISQEVKEPRKPQDHSFQCLMWGWCNGGNE
jgi:hypothetical protein